MTRARDVADTQDNLGGAVPPFVAGKNKIINGDFYVNQRNLTSTTSSGYGFDRWNFLTTNGTVTHSAQTFTTGTAPVTGYEGANFARIVTTGQTLASAYTIYRQNIENVRTFAGQTVTLSFWAKANSGTPKIAMEFEQSFGSGGSPSSFVTVYAGQATLSTSWVRYTATIAIPSISGKTIGTTTNSSSLLLTLWFSAGSDFSDRTGSLGIQSNTFDIWGVQVEAGSVATAFQTATGTLQGELAACQRYYYRANSAGAAYTIFSFGYTDNTTTALIMTPVPSYMRVFPTSVDYANLAFQEAQGGIFTFTAISLNGGSGATAPNNNIQMQITGASGMTLGRPGRLLSNGVTNGHLGFSAEL
jgi:hypothetical protein